MEQKKDLAIVLKTIRYQDRHQIITALTQKNGKISALAKNSVASRRFGGSLNVFCLSEWLFTEKASGDFFYLNEANLVQDFSLVSKTYEKYVSGCFLIELLLKFIPEKLNAYEIFLLHSEALAFLNKLSDSMLERQKFIFLSIYLMRLLKWHGSAPVFQDCFSCKKKLEVLQESSFIYYDIFKTRWCCTSCFQSHEIWLSLRVDVVKELLTSLTIQQSIDLTETTPKKHADEYRTMFMFLYKFLAHTLPHTTTHGEEMFKSLRFLDVKSFAL
ncbi:MAG: DNA repair protein RecO [Bdellovibrio sp.]|nr:DNA repair protein RecO [Bdellovibrio sp.]